MSRFLLTRAAQEDLEDIRAYHCGIPPGPALRIKSRIQKVIFDIAGNPYRGVADSRLTLLFGCEVRSRLASPYRIYYRMGRPYPEIIAILHGARDQATLLANRLS
jgi:plasmid stabilization system protein ParE